MSTFRNTGYMPKYSNYTQLTANVLPRYMRGQSEKYSMYQQIFNLLCLQYGDLNETLRIQKLNRFPQTFVPTTFDVFYSYSIPGTFSRIADSDGNTLNKSQYTNYEEWYYKSIPTGITETLAYTVDSVIIQRQPIKSNYKLDPVHYLNNDYLYISIYMENGLGINNEFDETVIPTKVKIIGKDQYNEEVEEELSFFYSKCLRTKNIYSAIYEIQTIYWDDESLIHIEVSSVPAFPYKEDPVFAYGLPSKDSVDVFWETPDNKTVHLKTYMAKDILQYYAGIKDHLTLKEYTPYIDDKTPSNSVNAVLPSYYDDKLYTVCDDGILCMYDKKETFSLLTSILNKLKTPDPIVNIDVIEQEDHLEIGGIYTRLHFNSPIDKFAYFIVKSDSVKLYFDPATEEWTVNKKLIDYPIKNTFGFYSPYIHYPHTYEQDMIVGIEVYLNDKNSTKFVDATIVDSRVLTPMFSTELSHWTDNSVLFYSKHDLLAYTADDKVYEIEFINKEYLFDETRNIVVISPSIGNITFFMSPIEVPISVSPTIHNYHNELDEYGTLFNFSRLTGERSYIYKKFLLDLFHKRPNATRNGLIYSLNREMRTEIKQALRLTFPSMMRLSISNGKISVYDFTDKYEFDLYNYDDQNGANTLIDVIDWLEQLNITVEIIDQNVPPRALLDTSNYSTVKDALHYNRVTIHIDRPYNAWLNSDSVNIIGYTKVNSAMDLDNLKNKSFYVSDNIIFINKPLDYQNQVSYETINKECILYASDILVDAVIDTEVEDGDRLSSFVEFTYPIRWTS